MRQVQQLRAEQRRVEVRERAARQLARGLRVGLERAQRLQVVDGERVRQRDGGREAEGAREQRFDLGEALAARFEGAFGDVVGGRVVALAA